MNRFKASSRGVLRFFLCRAVVMSDDLEIARESNLFRADPDRFLALDYVKAFPVYAAAAVSLAESEPVGRCW